MALILIADVERNMGRLLKYELENEGHVVDLLGQESAMTVANEVNTEHDAILLGRQMSCLDCYNKLKRIRRNNPEACIIVLTSYSAPEEQAQLYDAGADACFASHEISKLKTHLYRLYAHG